MIELPVGQSKYNIKPERSQQEIQGHLILLLRRLEKIIPTPGPGGLRLLPVGEQYAGRPEQRRALTQ